MARRTEAEFHNEIRDAIGKLERFDRDLSELFRRVEHPAKDGYAASSMGSSSKAPGAISDPTYMKATATTSVDQVYRQAGDALRLVKDACARISTAHNLRDAALSVEAEAKGRVSTIAECECCRAGITGIGERPTQERLLLQLLHRVGQVEASGTAAGEDPTNRRAFITERRIKLKDKAEEKISA